MTINFRGAAKRIEDIDLPRVARMIGVGEDEIHAILDVESAGSGFDAKGRPKMLFEPHLFYRFLTGEKRDKAVVEGLAYAEWRRGSYPADSYPRLVAAMLIDETAALRAASWGLGQILGDNYKLCGYRSPQEMVTDFTVDEDRHLTAMIRFIRARGLDDELRNHDWAGFARGYNGALYASHGYHIKLKAAYERWLKIKDTPIPPDVEPVPPKLQPKPKPPEHPAAKPTIIGVILGALAAVAAYFEAHPFVIGGSIFALILAFIGWRLLRNKS